MFLFGIRRDSSRDEAHACAARPTTTSRRSVLLVLLVHLPFHPHSPAPTFHYAPPGTSARSLLPPSCCFLVSSYRLPISVCADNSGDDNDVSLRRHCHRSSSKAIGKMDRRKGTDTQVEKKKYCFYSFQDDALIYKGNISCCCILLLQICECYVDMMYRICNTFKKLNFILFFTK